MRPSMFQICLLSLVAAATAREKQIQLEDIERDNLASERKVKQPTQYYQQQPAHAPPKPEPKMHFGFVPMKTPPNYRPPPQAQQQYGSQTEAYPRDLYVQPQQTYRQEKKLQYYVQPEYYAGQPDYVQPQQYYTRPIGKEQQQYLVQPQVEKVPPQQYYTRPQGKEQQQYLVQPQVEKAQPQQYYTRPQGKEQQQYLVEKAPQEQQYYVQPQSDGTQLYYIQPQQYQAQQYVVDNHLQPTNQQYYTPQQQYVYPQQYQASSNNIHSVVDAKGNVQYFMYVPVSALKGDPNYEHLLQSYAQPEQQYTYSPEPGVKYAPETTETTEKPPQKYTNSAPFAPKKQPTSLLDSYVPSYLQYQYYKQQQENANSIKQAPKAPQVGAGKSELVKSFAPARHQLPHPLSYQTFKQ